ncbi:MAG: hypothetical protein QM765_05270 [Myxococcales bacterium]
MPTIRENLEAFLAGRLPAEKLKLVYSDLHGLHGGLDLTIKGDGKVQQVAMRTSVHPPKDVSAAALRRLVELLIELEAWTQKVPTRAPVPDEGTARLTLYAGDEATTTWEWFNDLGKNKRLVKLKDAMCKAAWDPAKGTFQAWPL